MFFALLPLTEIILFAGMLFSFLLLSFGFLGIRPVEVGAGQPKILEINHPQHHLQKNIAVNTLDLSSHFHGEKQLDSCIPGSWAYRAKESLIIIRPDISLHRHYSPIFQGLIERAPPVMA